MRRGTTLAELLVAMTMLGVIGATAAGTLVQQGRVRTRVVGRLAGEAQLREAMAPLVADLGTASPAAGDFRAGEARDSALELRVTIATAYVCRTDGDPARTIDAIPLSGLHGRMVLAGDTAWLFQDGVWDAAGVAAAFRAPPATPSCSAQARDGVVLRVTLAPGVHLTVGAPVRFTRRMRYSLYRGSDARTWLGLREWSASAGTFSTVQPVAGPFDRAGTRFRYLDTLGTELRSGTASGTELGAVRIDLRSETPRGRAVADTADVPRAALTVGLRNRR